jgi:hypothetical protein
LHMPYVVRQILLERAEGEVDPVIDLHHHLDAATRALRALEGERPAIASAVCAAAAGGSPVVGAYQCRAGGRQVQHVPVVGHGQPFR